MFILLHSKRTYPMELYSEELDRKLHFKTGPWEHQFRALEFGFNLPGVMLAMDMGTGKTKTTIDLLANRGHKKILILSPKAVVGVWPKEFARHDPVGYMPIPLNIKGNLTKKTKFAEQQVQHANMYNNPYVVIVNYESAWREPFATWAAEMMKWDCVVCDESHKIKAPGGKASWFAYRMSKLTPYRVALTGTPMPHSPMDLYAQYRFVDSSIFPPSMKAFRNMYAIMGGYQNHQIVGFRNQEDMNRKFYSIAYRVKAEDVLDLPEFHDIQLEVELSPKAKKIYDAMSSALVAEVENGTVTAANAMVKLLRLQQITSGNVRPDESDRYETVDDSKIEALEELLDDLPMDEPIVVFVRFTEDARRVKEVIKKVRGTEAAELTGQAHEQEDFISGKKNEIVINIQSGGTGVDGLQDRARYCVYYSMGFSLGDYEQSRKRLHRPGQKRTVFYYHLVAKGTVDERVYKSLDSRRNVVDYVLEQASTEGVL